MCGWRRGRCGARTRTPTSSGRSWSRECRPNGRSSPTRTDPTAMSTTRAPSRPQAGTRRLGVPPEQVGNAVTTLALVYANCKRPLDAWAIPPKANVHGTAMPETLLIALYNAYKDQSQETRNRYADAYHLIIPEIRRVMPTVVGQM